MQQQKNHKKSTRIKVASGMFVMMLLGLFLVSYKTSKLGDEIWSQLGLTKQDGTVGISNSFLQGYLYYYSARNAKNIATGNRSVVVKELGIYAKQYVNSEAFKKEYLQNRESRKPVAPRPAKTFDEIRTEQRESYQKSIKSFEAMLKSDNADLRKMAKESTEYMQKQLKETEDPNNQILKLMADGEKLTYDTRMQEYKTSLEKWEKDMPADQMVLVKNRLQKFLSLTADVDFKAELKEQYGKKRFVNPSYEAKRPEWKQAFRAGKEATEASRSFAQEWLKELN